jgi:membrane fusion protein (multidrug efflux system)
MSQHDKSALPPLWCLALLSILLLVPLPGRAQTQSAVPVMTSVAQLQPVTPSREFVGRIEAKERVDIRARVTGFLEEIQFQEGQAVKAGDKLFLIEREPFEAAVAQSQGALLQAEARFANAAAQRARTQELIKTNTAPRSQLDERVAAEKGAQGDVVIANANLNTANINLGYTEITAPIAGEIGRSAVTKGNVVGPDSGPLTVIVSRDPMYVTFPVSQREFLDIERSEHSNANALAVRIRFSDGRSYPQIARIDFVDVTVNKATDTVLVRAVMPNPDGMLIDGQLVRVSVEAAKPLEKILIPQAALVVDQKGPYVFVAADGKAEVKRIKLGNEIGPNVVVEEGLAPGDLVVVQGMDGLRPGAPVSASPAPASGQG